MTKADGSQVDVQLDKSFSVVGSKGRRGGKESERERRDPPVSRVRHPGRGGHNGRVDTCSHCGGTLPARRDVLPVLRPAHGCAAGEERDVPIEVQHAEPRYFGLGRRSLCLARSRAAPARDRPGVTGFVVAGIVAIVSPSVSSLRSWRAPAAGPRRLIARLGISTADRVRDEAGVAVESVSAGGRVPAATSPGCARSSSSFAGSATRRSVSSAFPSTPTTDAPTS